MKNKILLSLSVVILLLIIAEVALRKVWGFGNMVLFRADKDYEYIAVANQDRMRFGKRSYYNEYSMRSMPLAATDSCIVLGLGDSVINGGTLTDQDSLATSIVENEWRRKHGNYVRFLNVSAGSWGPDNAAGYLSKYGHFKAGLLVLMVSSHDAYDNMTFEETVGHHEAYPDKQYQLAISEVVLKYLVPRAQKMMNAGSTEENLMINKNGAGFNKGFDIIRNYADSVGIPLVVCLHAEKEEVANGDFNEQGKEILRYCQQNDIKVISGLEVGESVDHYRDKIHLNEKGQRLWARVLENEIGKELKCLR